jgi:hypothetical protein
MPSRSTAFNQRSKLTLGNGTRKRSQLFPHLKVGLRHAGNPTGASEAVSLLEFYLTMTSIKLANMFSSVVGQLAACIATSDSCGQNA